VRGGAALKTGRYVFTLTRENSDMTAEPSRKQKVRAAFDQRGTQAALTLGSELRLAPATLRSWIGAWRRALAEVAACVAVSPPSSGKIGDKSAPRGNPAPRRVLAATRDPLCVPRRSGVYLQPRRPSAGSFLFPRWNQETSSELWNLRDCNLSPPGEAVMARL
jgi:hypothetical protein